MKKIFLGIDPDVDKSGLAIWSKESLTLHNLNFFNLLEAISKAKPTLVLLEAGWLNKDSRHAMRAFGASYNSRIGERVGRNHQAGILIAEYLERENIPHELIRPTKHKIKSNKVFCEFVKHQFSRSNQEQRDAAMLIRNHSVYLEHLRKI